MRVLHINAGNLYGGVETVLVTLARHRALCPQVDPHFAICFAGRLHDALNDANADVHFLGSVRLRHPLTVRAARRVLRDLLRAQRYDVVICHSAWAQVIFGPVVRRVGLPLVFWLHNATTGRHWLDRWCGRTAPDLAICNSRFTAGSLSKLYPGVPAEVVYCPVPTERAYSDRERATTRSELTTPPNATVIIQVSRMEAWKGHRLLFEALSFLRDLPNWICWQVGGSQRREELRYLQELEELAAQLGIAGRIRFLGERSDVARLLSAADIHCQPNNGAEPFGITFIEAMRAQLPVVTTDIGSASEIVTNASGILVPPRMPEALAGSLRQLISDPMLRRRLGSAGSERANLLCDPHAQISRLGECLQAISYKNIAI